jgi:hypothetical protein
MTTPTLPTHMATAAIPVREVRKAAKANKLDIQANRAFHCAIGAEVGTAERSVVLVEKNLLSSAFFLLFGRFPVWIYYFQCEIEQKNRPNSLNIHNLSTLLRFRCLKRPSQTFRSYA